jgi:hypothetical protein
MGGPAGMGPTRSGRRIRALRSRRRVVEADRPASPGNAPAASLGQGHVASGAPATFETRSIGRGNPPRPVLAGPGRVEPDGHFAAPRGEAVEHLRNGDAGVEQSFSFEKRPAGTGNLEVRVHVSGQQYRGETASGHHFVDPATGLGLRYGRATWIDGRGHRAMLSVRYAGGDLVITAPGELVDESAYPAVLDPIISAEMGDDPITLPAPKNQTVPAIAFDGKNYMVVWLDERQIIPGAYRFYATRVSPAGVLLDPGGIDVGVPATATSFLPRIVFDGTSYMVLLSLVAESDIDGFRVVRMTPTGTVLGPPVGPTKQWAPSMLSDHESPPMARCWSLQEWPSPRC